MFRGYMIFLYVFTSSAAAPDIDLAIDYFYSSPNGFKLAIDRVNNG